MNGLSSHCIQEFRMLYVIDCTAMNLIIIGFNSRMGRSGRDFMGLMFDFWMKLQPIAIFYYSGVTYKIFYRIAFLCSASYFIGIFRQPYVKRQVLRRAESQKQVQQQSVNSMLSKIQIKLSDYSEDYFVIISANCSPQKEEELAEKQRILFEFNEQINGRLEISKNYFGDVKFLFIGEKDIYNLLEVNSTAIELYEKERERGEAAVHIFAKDVDGTDKLITSVPYKADLTSILRIISKHKARKFASSMQF